MKKYFFSFAVIFLVIIFFSSVSVSLADTSSSGFVLPTGTGLSSKTVSEILTSFMKWLLGIFGFLAIISFLISGIMYLTSTGDTTQQEKAKNQMMWSIVGVIVGLSGFIVIQAIDTWLKGSSTQF